MAVHLTTNSSIMNGAGTFQSAVHTIHGLGAILPLVEWGFIFLPLLFHAIVGLIIIRSGSINTANYGYAGNVRYTLQRATGMVAFLFIMWHVFHMHGWFHADAWLAAVAEPLSGAKFRPYNAGSTAAAAMQASIVVPILYTIGVLSCIFHFANGLWTMGITWGLWTSPQAQARANWISVGVGGVLTVIGMSAIFGFQTLDVKEARTIEDEMYEAKVAAHEVIPNEHKRSHDDDYAASTDEHEEKHESGDHPEKKKADGGNDSGMNVVPPPPADELPPAGEQPPGP